MPCGVILAIAGCSNEPEVKEVVRPVKMMTLGAATAGGERIYPGKVNAMETARMSFEDAGRIIELPIKEGEEVKKGALLARLDPRDFEANLNSAKAEFAQAKAEYDRNLALYEQKVIALAQFQVKEKEFEVAQARMAVAQKSFDDTYLKAPFDGVVSARFVKNFEQVQAKQEICVVEDVSELEVIVDIPERDMARGRPDKTVAEINREIDVNVEFAALPGKEFPLRLKEYQTRADPETQTFRITMVMNPPENSGILPGMTASVIVPTVDLGIKPGAQYKIPANAVYSDAQGNPFVWVVNKDNTVKKMPVELGPMTGKEITISEGLKSGDTIAVSGVNFLQDGMEVRPFDDNSGGGS